MHKPIPPISFNSTQEINEKLRQISNDLDGGKWVNDRFDTQNKPCRFVRILQRMFTVFGVDMFCHIRVNNVAISIFTTANDHKKYLNAESKHLIDEILKKLDENTKGKYVNIIQMAKASMNGLNGKISQGYAAPAKPGVVPPPPPPPPQNQMMPAQQAPAYRPLPTPPSPSEDKPAIKRVNFMGKERGLEDKIFYDGKLIKVKEAIKIQQSKQGWDQEELSKKLLEVQSRKTSS